MVFMMTGFTKSLSVIRVKQKLSQLSGEKGYCNFMMRFFWRCTTINAFMTSLGKYLFSPVRPTNVGCQASPYDLNNGVALPVRGLLPAPVNAHVCAFAGLRAKRNSHYTFLTGWCTAHFYPTLSTDDSILMPKSPCVHTASSRAVRPLTMAYFKGVITHYAICLVRPLAPLYFLGPCTTGGGTVHLWPSSTTARV